MRIMYQSDSFWDSIQLAKGFTVKPYSIRGPCTYSCHNECAAIRWQYMQPVNVKMCSRDHARDEEYKSAFGIPQMVECPAKEHLYTFCSNEIIILVQGGLCRSHHIWYYCHRFLQMTAQTGQAKSQKAMKLELKNILLYKALSTAHNHFFITVCRRLTHFWCNDLETWLSDVRLFL